MFETSSLWPKQLIRIYQAQSPSLLVAWSFQFPVVTDPHATKEQEHQKILARTVQKCALSCRARFCTSFSKYRWSGFCCFLCRGYSEPCLWHLSTVFPQLHGRFGTKDMNIYVRQKVTKGQIEAQHSLLKCQLVPSRLCQMQKSIILQCCQLPPEFVQDIQWQWVEAKGKEKQLMY